jgi:hypothetical protein
LHTYQAVLFIHLLALFVGIGAGAVLVLSLLQLRAAQTLEDAVPWGTIAGKVGRVFPVAILGLFGSGAYMTSDAWSWSTGWIDVAIAGLVVLALQGPLVSERYGKKVEHALRENGPGPLGPHARRMARHPVLWVSELSSLALVFAITWNMTQKPGTAGAVAAVVVGYLAGAALALLFGRLPVEERAPLAEPASGP